MIPIRYLQWIKKRSLARNPYLKDMGIGFPLPNAQKTFTQQTLSNPPLGEKFANFLLAYRPLQHKLAMHILHAAKAGIWQQHPCESRVLTVVEVTDKLKKFRPDNNWKNLLQQAKKALYASEDHSRNLADRIAAFQTFLEHWEALRAYNLQPVPKNWNKHYQEAFDLWLKVGQEKLEALKHQLQEEFPIAQPIYRPGHPLRAGIDNRLFLGRNDVEKNLKDNLYATNRLPLFLIQGQRRVGKTSFLKFLPQILGSGYRVVFIDLQGKVARVEEWFEVVKKRLEEEAKEKFEGEFSEEWGKAWGELEGLLIATQKALGQRIVLAFDEYEYLHDALQADPKQAAFLLGAMRNFSQHQEDIVFMFVGAALFSELRSPNWNEYFTQASRLTIDYLPKAAAVELMELVPLSYPKPLKDNIFHFTQGHPALLQRICEEMVHIANADRRTDMTASDLTQIISTKILQPDTTSPEIFWTQFCRPETDPHAQEVVLAIVKGTLSLEQVGIHRKTLIRLETHKFIVREGDGFRMRVPLFEQWVERFGI